MTRPAPPFRHTPYDGSSKPFTVGLKPIGEEVWLEPDAFLVRHLTEKERLFAVDRDAVFRHEADTGAAQDEVLALILDNLSRFHSATHLVSETAVELRESGRTVALGDRPALMTASRLVQEDLVLMRPGEGGYRLAAASLCFPSSWSLAEKFGLSMTGIHEGVPGFNGSRIGQMVARVFDNLAAGQFLERFNWSIYSDAALHHPQPKRIDINGDGSVLAKLFLRVERQTLRRLPGSGDILFTIKVHHDPLAALKARPDRAELAAGLRTQLLALDEAQLSYKGFVPIRDGLAAELEQLID
ncbi:heme-dependent oxidative N-demethylase family protein [Roseibium sp. M-1]